MVLRKTIEGNMAGTAKDGGEIALSIGRAIGVSRGTEFFQSETGLIGRRGGRMLYILTENGKGFPESKCFEGKNDLCPTPFANRTD